MKIKYLNIFFRVIAIIIIIRLFFYENFELGKLSFLLSPSIIILFSLVIFSKLLLTYLFYLLLRIVSLKDLSFHRVSNYFLQGGMVNQLIPGVGFIYKYMKLNNDTNINISEFSTAQSLWSFLNLGAYILLAIIFGYLSISSTFKFWLIIISLIFLLFIIFKLRTLIYLTLKKYLLKIKRVFNLIDQLKIVKSNINERIYFIFFVFFGFIFLALLQCFNFYIGLKLFGSDISFMSSTYVYISTSLATIVTMFTFIGGFELMLHFSSSLIVPNIKNILVFGFAYRFISIISTFILIIIFSIWDKTVQKPL